VHVGLQRTGCVREDDRAVSGSRDRALFGVSRFGAELFPALLLCCS